MGRRGGEGDGGGRRPEQQGAEVLVVQRWRAPAAAEVLVPAAVDGPVPRQGDPGDGVERQERERHQRPGRSVEVGEPDDQEDDQRERVQGVVAEGGPEQRRPGERVEAEQEEHRCGDGVREHPESPASGGGGEQCPALAARRLQRQPERRPVQQQGRRHQADQDVLSGVRAEQDHAVPGDPAAGGEEHDEEPGGP
ncbi:hypothetical protein GCM10010402_83140 [Actinomadura luteofluorescens]